MNPKFAIDTSLAIPLLVASHSAHQIVTPWARGKQLLLSGHACLETYSVLTRLPADLRLPGPQARELIDERFSQNLSLDAEVCAVAYREFAGVGIVGGAVYDGLVALAARAANMPLATGDLRAAGTYQLLGVGVTFLNLEDEPPTI